MRSVQTALCRAMLGIVAAWAVGPPALAAEPLALATGHPGERIVLDRSRPPAIDLTIDIARVLRLAEQASTIVIGNPGIANATLTDGRTVVLTGMAAGTTNMIVLDETGAEVANLLLSVGTTVRPQVRVYNGLRRQTYSCALDCEPVSAVGDANDYFETVLTQTRARQEFSGAAGTGSP